MGKLGRVCCGACTARRAPCTAPPRPPAPASTSSRCRRRPGARSPARTGRGRRASRTGPRPRACRRTARAPRSVRAPQRRPALLLKTLNCLWPHIIMSGDSAPCWRPAQACSSRHRAARPQAGGCGAVQPGSMYATPSRSGRTPQSVQKRLPIVPLERDRTLRLPNKHQPAHRSHRAGAHRQTDHAW